MAASRPTSPCGTYGGYIAHYKYNTKPCLECKVAAKAYRKNWYIPKTRNVNHTAAQQLQAFWAKTSAQNACLVWKGARKYNGYGEFRKKVAHRWIYQQSLGPLPVGIILLHSCDNRLCVALQHLSPGTDALNARDASNKGRTTRGERNAQAKLTWEQVRAIRASADKPKILAKKYGVSQATISGILRKKTWQE